MTQLKIGRLLTAMVTPFDEANGSVDPRPGQAIWRQALLDSAPKVGGVRDDR
jgi:hypothetical protein